MKPRFARLLLLITCLVAWTATALGAGALSDEAKKHFDSGVAYVDDPSGSKWDEALKEFRAAYAASPTWKLMNNIGLCALNLERDGEAIEAYKDYLAHGGESDFTAKQRKQMEKDIAMLSASLVRVTITVDPPEAILVDERKNSKGGVLVNQYPISNGKASLGLHPGMHQFTVQAPGYVSAEWSFNGDPSSTHQHEFKLELEKKAEMAPAAPMTTSKGLPPSDVESPQGQRKTPTMVYVGLAATGVFAAAATVTGVLALGKNKDFDNATDPAEEDRLKKSGKTFVLLTDIGIGAAVLSAGATAYFYFTAPKDTQPKTGKTRIQFTPTAGPNAAGLAVFGKF